ncbi:pancreatic triacylglycerol lipase-like [Toxorhynchites rutilus septentrionalis]|uniref:pancreatic triacylglycerol lipase-like n=1 Tax=Toxorhynchites rutilus septentrionalis TaxID=329112 RepID=UPI0024794BEA|nr:pancreatic triacylglycerol lipase-like [Toxorhynchites rutilus septentrionalis]
MLTLIVLSSLVLGGLASPVDVQPEIIMDSTGHPHLVNLDPYEIKDVEFEPLFNAEEDMSFRLFTRLNPDVGQVLRWNDPSSIFNSNFNPSHPTRFTIHGWRADGESDLHSMIRYNYLARGDFNVISVDWGQGSKTINYYTARKRVSEVGDLVSRLIVTLSDTTGISLDSINVIGHSLGAHAAGNAGKYLNGALNTIVGLDPAGPFFSEGHDDILSSGDARYVEAVSTNAGTLGFKQPLGHANFYPNGGKSQPGCGIDLIGTCAHSRSYEYFAESLITRVGFVAIGCETVDDAIAGRCNGHGAIMGGEPSNRGFDVYGIFRFNTNSASPFAQGYVY